MSFFNDIGKKTSVTTSKIAREAKLKLKINENKCKISDFYEEMGKKVYEKHVREDDMDIAEELEIDCKRVDEVAMEIETARIEILRLNQKKQCKKCNIEIRISDIFCHECGEKQVEEEKTVFDEALEKLEEVEIEPENKEKAKNVKKELKEKIEE